MAITMQQVLARLDTDEPDYAALSTLGPEAVPHLAVLVRSDDPGIASKAAYLASLIESDESVGVVEAAATSSHETVRVAAAASLSNLTPAQAAPAIERLLEDSDVGVRKLALRAVDDLEMNALASKVKKMAADDPEKELRQLAREGLQRASETQSTEPKAAKATKAAETGAAKRAAAKRTARQPKRSKK